MNVLLTDYLTCPRCGPNFGLILLAQEVHERKVRTGEFGCPNCRDRFQVADGFTDLRAPPRPPLTPEARIEDPSIDPVKIAACLGVAEGPGFFVFMGAACACAAGVAALVNDMEVVTVGAPGTPLAGGVSPIAADLRLPIRGGAKGVVLSLDQWDQWGPEVVRVAAPRARIVVTRGSLGTAGLPSHPALELLLDDAGFGVFQKG